MRTRLNSVLAMACVVSLGACGSDQEGASASNDALEITLDDDARRAVIETAAEALRSRYVFPDIGERAAEMIEAEFATGSYDDLESPWGLAERLTADLQEVAQDRHLRIFALGPVPTNAGAVTPPPPARSEGGVTRADLLSDNIGYIEVVAFPPIEMFKPAVDRAMAPLRDARALIIDVRRNGGGSPVSVSYLVSYFLDAGAEPVKINEFVWRNPGTETFVLKSSGVRPRRSPTPASRFMCSRATRLSLAVRNSPTIWR